MKVISLLFGCLLLISTVFAGYNANAKNNVAVYWGQGANQESLGYYCQKGNIDIVLLAFITHLNSTYVGYNFGNACWGRECPLIAQDIKICQKLGVKVLLSIGGDKRVSDYGLTSDNDGIKAAQMLYDMFNPEGDSKVTKVFGDVEVDGFDLDVENHNQKGQIALFKQLRKLWTSKTLLLTACPQCTYPDVNVNDVMVDADVNLDIAFLQFYSNNGCSMIYLTFLDSWKTWKNFTENVSKSKNLKIYITLQAEGSNQWHTKLDYLNEQVGSKKRESFFGGFGAWDATVGTNTLDSTLGTEMTYINGLKQIASGVYDSKLSKRDEL